MNLGKIYNNFNYFVNSFDHFYNYFQLQLAQLFHNYDYQILKLFFELHRQSVTQNFGEAQPKAAIKKFFEKI